MHINGISQNQVAVKLGVSYDYVNKILNGRECPANAEERIMAAIDEIIAERS
jgi:transcriptional regulator with XRE-family HTH domain